MQRTHRTQTGVTLVEQLVTTTVASLVALASLPGLEEAKDKRRLESAVAQIESELQYARSSAVARGDTVRVAFRSTDAGSCYVMHGGRPGDCRCSVDGTAQCAPGVEVMRSVGFTNGSGLRLTSTAQEVGFDATHGTVTPTTTLQIENRGGARVRLVVNVMGRIRSCATNPGALDPVVC